VQIDVWLHGEKKCPVNVYFSSPTETGCMAYIVDISARKELEHQLIQSQKMQAIGQLAGGVAHDFNNLLTAIRLNTDDLLGRHPVGDPSYPELQKINQTVARAAGLVRKLLAFSRKQTMRAQTLDVTETLSDLSVLLNQVMVAKVQLDVFHGRDLPSIQADKGQLETVLMNLCVNARDAMVEKGSGGTITLRSAKASDADLEKDGIKTRAEGGYVLITVSDTGTGIDAETQKKIFEPFFTTKEQGKGTGLGLATVYGIVEQSGGHLRVDSTPGVGTTFKVYIPTSTEKDKQVAPARKIPVVVKPADLSGQGNILFVEDEAAVRTISAKTLRKRGYTVTEAGDGEEAYEILEDATEPFDLMISDVVMPGMDGPTLLKQGRTLLGDARIVFISGYAEEEFSDLLAEEPDVTFLPKPFTLTQLLEKVKSVIGEPV
jgi:two-component system cell cycle sensor histidine kinase/response regulator CckA